MEASYIPARFYGKERKMIIKKILVPLAVAIVLTACKSEDVPTSTKADNVASSTKASGPETTTEVGGNKSSEFTKEYALVGYNIYTPEGLRIDSAGYGKIYFQKKDDIEYTVTFGCPGASGVMLNLEKLEDAPEASVKYLTHNVEFYRSYFGSGMAQQKIGKTEKVTINGIEMLYSEGELYGKNNPDVLYPYQAYYWLSNGSPVYLLCMAPDHPDASSAYLDAMIHCVQKRN